MFVIQSVFLYFSSSFIVRDTPNKRHDLFRYGHRTYITWVYVLQEHLKYMGIL